MNGHSPINHAAERYGVPIAAIFSRSTSEKAVSARQDIIEHLDSCGVRKKDIALLFGRSRDWVSNRLEIAGPRKPETDA